MLKTIILYFLLLIMFVISWAMTKQRQILHITCRIPSSINKKIFSIDKNSIYRYLHILINLVICFVEKNLQVDEKFIDEIGW